MHAPCLLAALLAACTLVASTVVFHGGAGEVGGSCATVRSGDSLILVDCGTAYGDGEGRSSGDKRPECGFPFNPKVYGDLLLTHAHQDHAGRVPELFNAGFTGTVWVTEATRDLLAVAWKSQVIYDTCTERNWRWAKQTKKPGTRVHWHRDCEWSQKIGLANLGTFHGVYADLQRHLEATALSSTYMVACRICQELELKELLGHVRTVPFDRPVAVGPFKVTFSPVKHLPGAACIRIEEGASSLLFSGDLGTKRSHLVRTIQPARKADVVFVESTYGDASQGTPEDIEQDYARFRSVVGKTVREGGVAWVPAFALDRSQRVLLEIKRGMDEGTIPADTPIHYLSPSSRDFTALYIDHPEWFDVPDMMGLASLFKQTKKSFNPLARRKSGAILLTTSGMMDTGFSLRFVPDLVPQEKTTVCLVGYQSPGTYGFQLKQIAEGKSSKTSLRLREGNSTREVPVKASVYVFSCFSGHGDAPENDAWLAKNRDSRIFLVHGDKAALKARADGLRARFGAKVEVVEPGREYEFE